MPKNIESYYQQIGRAGRDGLKADCLFLSSYGDVGKIRYFIEQKSEKEQKIANQHLEDLLSFVEARVCRRKPLLEYFGEAYNEDSCEMCDICTGELPDTEDITIPAQKFLSTIVRTEQRYGFHHIKNILIGSKRKKVLQVGHDRLSTYGIGDEFTGKQWKQLYRELMNQNLIRRDKEHGSIRINDTAVPVLKGEEKVHGAIDEPETHHTKAGAKTDVESLDYDRELFRQLKVKRKELARNKGVPPYVIFPDATLIEMSFYFPQSDKNLLAIYGVGNTKKRKYGDAFLDLIIGYCEQYNIAENPKEPRNTRSTSTRVVSANRRYHKVGKAYCNGSSITQIAATYGVKKSTVINNLGKYVKGGNKIPADELRNISTLKEKTFSKVVEQFKSSGPDFLRPVYEAFNEEISYDELRIVQLYVLAQNAS